MTKIFQHDHEKTILCEWCDVHVHQFATTKIINTIVFPIKTTNKRQWIRFNARGYDFFNIQVQSLQHDLEAMRKLQAMSTSRLREHPPIRICLGPMRIVVVPAHARDDDEWVPAAAGSAQEQAGPWTNV